MNINKVDLIKVLGKEAKEYRNNGVPSDIISGFERALDVVIQWHNKPIAETADFGRKFKEWEEEYSGFLKARDKITKQEILKDVFNEFERFFEECFGEVEEK